MVELIGPYHPTATAYLVLGGLFLVQALALDLASIRAGHTPGMPVSGGHESLLFRVTRAHANTNENFGVFIVLSLAAVLLAADPWWTNLLTGGFVASRALHMAAYYADLRLLRSAAFGLGLVALAGLFVCALAA